jgi:hypothetical protein
MDPTPPPEVIAMTKFTYEERGSGSDAKVKMWVTNVRREGPFTKCEGWLVRYPPATQPVQQTGTATNPISGSINVSTSVSTGAKHNGTLPPIVEAHATTICQQRNLVPFAPSPAPSP